MLFRMSLSLLLLHHNLCNARKYKIHIDSQSKDIRCVTAVSSLSCSWPQAFLNTREHPFCLRKRSLARPASEFGHSLDEWVGEEEHQGNHQTINGQGLHEGQGQQQHTSQVICHLRLARDAINASAGGNALANTRTDRSQANGEASANGRQCRDPHGALISKCCLWCHQSGRGQSCCGSSACSRSRHMGAARGRHEGGQECTAAQQHGTSQDERASHLYQSKFYPTGNRSWYWRT